MAKSLALNNNQNLQSPSCYTFSSLANNIHGKAKTFTFLQKKDRIERRLNKRWKTKIVFFQDNFKEKNLIL